MIKRSPTAEGMYPIRELPYGEFVRKTATAKKVYQVGDYNRRTGKYDLIDVDDINRDVQIKAGAEVFAGFTY